MTKRCLKCAAITEVEASDPSAACGKCGAIFAKVEATKAESAREPEPGPPSMPPRHARDSVLPKPPPLAAERPFLSELRAATNYPTFRAVVNFFYWFWLLLAAFVAIATVVSVLFRGGEAFTGVGGVFLTLFFVFIGRLIREVSMMVADIGDATIYSAQRAK